MKTSTKWTIGAVIVLAIAAVAIWYSAANSGTTYVAPPVPADSGQSTVQGQPSNYNVTVTPVATTSHATTTKKKMVN